MYHSRDIADLRADVRANCVIFLDLCKEAGLPVLVTETVRDDEYQRYLAANGYAAKTATRPTFHGVKAGLAFDICKIVKGHEYDDPSFFARCGQIGKQVGFSWGGESPRASASASPTRAWTVSTSRSARNYPRWLRSGPWHTFYPSSCRRRRRRVLLNATCGRKAACRWQWSEACLLMQ